MIVILLVFISLVHKYAKLKPLIVGIGFQQFLDQIKGINALVVNNAQPLKVFIQTRIVKNM